MVEKPLFEDAWSRSKVRIFRLESLPVYNVPEDMKIFEEWKKTKKFSANSYEEWLQKLEKTKERGVVMQRVRVAQLPLSDYLKYEVDFWKNNSIKAGEQISFIEKEKYQKLLEGLDFKQEDFWMFDDKLVIIFHYSENGNLLNEELVTDPVLVNRHVQLKKALLENSMDMTPFLYKVKHLNIANKS